NSNNLDRISYCSERGNIEIKCSTKEIIPIEKSVIPPPVITSIDIETYSHDHDRFPKHSNKDDIAYLMSLITVKSNGERITDVIYIGNRITKNINTDRIYYINDEY